jgi:predicted SAM-dependent methyltransferase
MSINREIIANSYLIGQGIEIGALHNPLTVKNEIIVNYVDRLNKESLYEQYPELLNLPLVDVDIIDDGETLKKFNESQLDFIIANHFLEHCENPILTLVNFHRVLKSQGIVYLAIPNKEFTFDVNRPRTSLDHLVIDYTVGPETSRFKHYLEWAKFVDPFFGRSHTADEEIDRANFLMGQGYSIHYHVWVAEDIFDLIKYLSEIVCVSLEIIFFAKINDEMVFILQKTDANIMK